jgi:hypothetical protein
MMEEPDYADLIEEYKKTGQIPAVWQITAREFVCAANILRKMCEDEGCFASGTPNGNSLWKPYGVIKLLYGLALENLRKGLLIAQGVDATSAGKLNGKLQTHNLIKLWKWAKLPLTDRTEQLLKILEWSITSGKYPVSTKPDPQAPQSFYVAMAGNQGFVTLIETVEDALRNVLQEKKSILIFEKTDLLKLCCEE